MDAVDLGVNLFVALFALVDPIGNIPIFAAATAGASTRQRLSVAALICLFAALFLGFFFFTGLSLLQFFGISLAAFRIAGGILLLLLGLDMTSGEFLKTFHDPDHDPGDVRGYARRRFQRLVVPFAIPLMIGPGAISTIIIQAGEAAKIEPAGSGLVAGVAAILAACLAAFLCFAATGPISRLLGEVGMSIVVRVLGLILCALAIQFILMGLSEALPGMISGAVTTPYPEGGH